MPKHSLQGPSQSSSTSCATSEEERETNDVLSKYWRGKFSVLCSSVVCRGIKLKIQFCVFALWKQQVFSRFISLWNCFQKGKLFLFLHEKEKLFDGTACNQVIDNIFTPLRLIIVRKEKLIFLFWHAWLKRKIIFGCQKKRFASSFYLPIASWCFHRTLRHVTLAKNCCQVSATDIGVINVSTMKNNFKIFCFSLNVCRVLQHRCRQRSFHWENFVLNHDLRFNIARRQRECL